MPQLGRPPTTGLAVGAEHDLLGGLLDDDHTQYLFTSAASGRVGGQELVGGVNAGDTLDLVDTANVAGGFIRFFLGGVVERARFTADGRYLQGLTTPTNAIHRIQLNDDVASGVRFGYISILNAVLTANSTATFTGGSFDARLSAPFNLGELVGAESCARTDAGFSGGVLSEAIAHRTVSQHDGAGAVTDWVDSEVRAPDGSGAGVVTRWTQSLLRDLVGLTITTRIGYRQIGTNAHNRFNGGVRFGADAAPNVTGGVEIGKALSLSGDISDTIAANQNDYAPAGLADASTILIDGGAANRTITGLTGGVDGRIIAIVNAGASNSVILSDQDGLSVAANRFRLSMGSNLSLRRDGGACLLRYNGVISRWECIGEAA